MLRSLALTLLVWLVMALAITRGGGSASQKLAQPYGPTTSLEEHALDLLFQLRNARRPALRLRGEREPIVIVGRSAPLGRCSCHQTQPMPARIAARQSASAMDSLRERCRLKIGGVVDAARVMLGMPGGADQRAAFHRPWPELLHVALPHPWRHTSRGSGRSTDP